MAGREIKDLLELSERLSQERLHTQTERDLLVKLNHEVAQAASEVNHLLPSNLVSEVHAVQ